MSFIVYVTTKIVPIVIKIKIDPFELAIQ